ncbi:MAG TPA: TIM barrel protein [Phycisphaerae bacterium]|nr:TIM barrel protein [Phycisphaerae bacterium]
MSTPIPRREVLGRSAAVLAAAMLGGTTEAQTAGSPCAKREAGDGRPRLFKLGLVTYNLAKDWDLPTIIQRCREIGLAAVELRTGQKHGVEPGISKNQQKEVRKRFTDSPVVLWGLGTACQYHEVDPAAVARNIEETKRFAELAHDVGAKGVKVRPNGLPKDVPVEKTLEQIGRALRTCGQAAADLGVELWVEVHGSGTCEPRHMRKIMDWADHPNVGVTWNSNLPCDLIDGSILQGFDLLADKIRSVHINELINGYPYRELFGLLRGRGYDRYTLMEIQGLAGPDPADTTRFARFYAGLWDALSSPA